MIDVVLVHHGDGRFTYPGEPALRRPGPWIRGDGRSEPPVGPVVAVCGIGRPADFLASLDLPVARFVALPDHAPIDGERAHQIAAFALPIVCTHKDAVRMPDWLRARSAWRDVDLVLPSALLARLARAARR